jgi:phage tail-like protein
VAAADRPYGKFRFKVEVDGLTLAHFQSVSGLSHEIEVLTHQEGGVNNRLHKLPGQGSYPNLTLKVGYVHNQLLENWHNRFTQKPGSIGRKNVSVVLVDDRSQEVARWSFARAWPVKWEGPEFDASAAQILVESVEIAHEGPVRGG